MSKMKLGVVLLASGRSERFGKNKLLADFDNRPMVCCALDAAKQLCAARSVVVTDCKAVSRLAQAYGFETVYNDDPLRGQSYSICLGVSCMQDMDALLLMVCDQPLLSAQSLQKLIRAFSSGEKGIACLCDRTHMGNPAVFSTQYYLELLALSGDRGAKGLLRAHAKDLLVVHTIGNDELSDADTPQELAELEAVLKK